MVVLTRTVNSYLVATQKRLQIHLHYFLTLENNPIFSIQNDKQKQQNQRTFLIANIHKKYI